MSKKKKTINELMEDIVVAKEDQPYDLPKNWVWTTIGVISNLTDYVANGSFQSLKDNVSVYDDEEYSYYVRLYDLRRGIGHHEQKYVDKQSYEFLSKSSLSGGEILLASVGSVGAVYLMPELKKPSTVAPNLIICKVNEKLNNKYLYYFLKSPVGQELINKISTGTTQQKINKTNLKTVAVPVPPLDEQKRISKKVERLLLNIEEAKQLIEETKKTFEIRRAAILNMAFRGELTEKWREKNQYENVEFRNKGPYKLPNGWEWKRLGELGNLERGKSKHRPRNDPKLFGGDYPFIQTGDVARAKDYVEEFNQTLSEFGLNQAKLFPVGTVCITIAANIADTAVLKFPCCFPDSVVGFIPNDERISSEFIHYYISTIKNDIEHYAPATAQKNINLKILNEVLVPIPPKKEHDEIIIQINYLLEKESKASECLMVGKSIEMLERAILHKAFQGELGTNDTIEESAIELLKEVLQQK